MKQTKIHHTMGLYPNGSVKHNGVLDKDLPGHHQYNLEVRPGRAFFIDGKCVHRGMGVPDEFIAHWEAKLEAELPVYSGPTYPYK